METYQQITLGLIIIALIIKLGRYFNSEKETLWKMLSNVLIIIAIAVFIRLMDVSGLKTFCYWLGGTLLFYFIGSTIVKIFEYQFEKEDEKIMDN